MNKVPNRVKMEYKAQTTTVLVTVFVVVGLIFLVPGITEKAQASVNARVGFSPCDKPPCSKLLLTLVSKSLKQGQFTSDPTPSGSCNPGCSGPLSWKTTGNPVGGTEEGSVTYKVENSVTQKSFTATLSFKNPEKKVSPFVVNTCGISTNPTQTSTKYSATGSPQSCSVSSKTAAQADWTYTLKAVTIGN